jgi:hypothetical protein
VVDRILLFDPTGRKKVFSAPFSMEPSIFHKKEHRKRKNTDFFFFFVVYMLIRGHLTVVEKKGRKVQNGLLGKWPPYGKKVEKGGRVEKGGEKGDGVRV